MLTFFCRELCLIHMKDQRNFMVQLLATLCGDNPGSAAVAGFKESTSAQRYCRQCLGTKAQISTIVC